MACMEHECNDCGHLWFNNYARGGKCPKCGSLSFHTTFDEDPSNDDEYEEDFINE